MKNGLITATVCTTLIMGATACSGTRETKKADPTKIENKAMRHRNQATDLNNAGSQKDNMREMTK